MTRRASDTTLREGGDEPSGRRARPESSPGSGSPGNDAAAAVTVARLASGGQFSNLQLRALQRTIGNRAIQRLIDGAAGGAAGVRSARNSSVLGAAVQRAKNPERQRLERRRMWTELFRQKGIEDTDAAALAVAFAHSGTSAATVLHFASLLGQGWDVGGVTTVVRKFVGDSGGRTEDEWLAIAIRRPGDPDAVGVAARAGAVDWANAAVTFRTDNDRYRATSVEVEGLWEIWTYDGDAAVPEDRQLTTAHDVFDVVGSGLDIYATRELAALLTSDSTYTVTATGYQRYAPVNLVQAPDQVHFGAPRHFCYLPPGSAVNGAVMSTPDDADITVTGVEGGEVVFDIKGREYRAPIEPSAGDMPFDFDYDANDGSISHGHPGHALYFG